MLDKDFLNNMFGIKVPTITFTTKNEPLPERYIINDGATILFWEDGSKTIVKLSDGDIYDKRLGFLVAYFQHSCGLSKTKANKYLDSLADNTPER